MATANKSSSLPKQNIFVTVRLRPLNSNEAEISKVESVRVINNNSLCVSDEISNNKKNAQVKDQQFFFDYVFDKDASQKLVYENTTKFLLNNIIEGFNLTVFAYGATGSGKTYTMLGTNKEQGIMPRSVSDLFKRMKENKNKEFLMMVSYIEIYNENIRDLLSNGEVLDIVEDSQKGTIIPNMAQFEVKTTENFYELLFKGNKKRTTASTNSNEASSRSHVVLKISLENKDKEGDNKNDILTGKLILVDLAGSEKSSKYANPNPNSKQNLRQLEGVKINQSLLSLGICINALASKSKFIPWRDSKLTRILKEYLGGNSRIVMINNISPSLFCVDETINTLVYANRAKNIQTIIKKNVISNLDMDFQMNKYNEIIGNLTSELEDLRHQLAIKIHNKHLLPQNDKANEQTKIDKITKKISQHFAEEIRLKQECFDIEKYIYTLNENLKDKEFTLFKLINDINKFRQTQKKRNNMINKNNNNFLLKEKEARSQINKINEQINIQKHLLVDKESKYSELYMKRGQLEAMIGKVNTNQSQPGNLQTQIEPNASNYSSLQYLYHSFVFEINNMNNDFLRKKNLYEIRSKDIRIQKLLEQIKIRDEYIRQEKKEIAKRKVNFVFENEKDIRNINDLGIEKNYSLPLIVQQDATKIISSKRQPLSPVKKSLQVQRINSANRFDVRYDYSGYNNPNIIKEKKIIKTKTNEIINKSKKRELTELKLNILNDEYKNSKVFYVNKQNPNYSFNDDNYVITFDTKFLNKSQSNDNLTNKSQSDLLNNSNLSRGYNYKEREIENKIKRVMVGKKKSNPYLNY